MKKLITVSTSLLIVLMFAISALAYDPFHNNSNAQRNPNNSPFVNQGLPTHNRSNSPFVQTHQQRQQKQYREQQSQQYIPNSGMQYQSPMIPAYKPF